MEKADTIIAGLTSYGGPEFAGDGGTMFDGAMPNTVANRKKLEKAGHVLDGIGGKTWMKMFDHLKVTAPTAESQVPGTNEHVAVVFCG